MSNPCNAADTCMLSKKCDGYTICLEAEAGYAFYSLTGEDDFSFLDEEEE